MSLKILQIVACSSQNKRHIGIVEYQHAPRFDLAVAMLDTRGPCMSVDHHNIEILIGKGIDFTHVVPEGTPGKRLPICPVTIWICDVAVCGAHRYLIRQYQSHVNITRSAQPCSKRLLPGWVVLNRDTFSLKTAPKERRRTTAILKHSDATTQVFLQKVRRIIRDQRDSVREKIIFGA